MIRLRYATASVAADPGRGVGLVDVRGVVSPQVAAAILSDNAQWLRRHALLAQVVRYDRSVLGVTTEQLFAAAIAEAARELALSAPTALVVQPELLPMMSAYARLANEHGVPRMVFSDVERAQAWAARQAVLAQRWRAAAAAIQASPAPCRTAAS